MISIAPAYQKRLIQKETPFRYFCGCHNAAWLYEPGSVPFFVSRNRLPTKKPKKAKVVWGCDSGGFTELQKFGRWTIDEKQYASLVNFWAEEIGSMLWAAQQDWMCEPIVINGGKAGNQHFVGTKLSVREHQKRTVENYLILKELCNPMIIPVIQGFTIDEYHYCIDLFAENGVDLTTLKVVGVGSICRRQATLEAVEILKSINARGINIHGFGLKTAALARVSDCLVSADSMSWSFSARYAKKSCGRIGKHTREPVKNCANCHHAAVEFYNKIIGLI